MILAKNYEKYLNLLQLCIINHTLFFPDTVYTVYMYFYSYTCCGCVNYVVYHARWVCCVDYIVSCVWNVDHPASAVVPRCAVWNRLPWAQGAPAEQLRLDATPEQQHCSDVKVNDRTFSGRLFQTASTAAARARSLMMVRWVRRPTSAEVVVAQRTCCRKLTSETRSRSADRHVFIRAEFVLVDLMSKIASTFFSILIKPKIIIRCCDFFHFLSNANLGYA